MLNVARWGWLVGLVACTLPADPEITGNETPVDPPTTETGLEEPCEATLVSVVPGNKSTLVPLDTTVMATFSEEITEDDFTLEVATVGGVTTLAEDGLSATWVSDSDLEPGVTYVVSAVVCGEVTTSTFETTTEDAPPAGSHFSVELSDGTWVSPKGASALSSLISIPVLLAPTSTTKTLQLLVAVGDPVGGAQDVCTLTGVASDPDFKPPEFEASLDRLVLDTGGIAVAFTDVVFRGTWPEKDGDPIEDVEMEGFLDVRPAAGSILGSTPEQVCSFIFDLTELKCGPCPDKAGDYCFDAHLEDLTGEVETGGLLPIDQTAIDNNPKCSTP